MIVALGGVGQHARAAAGRLDRRRHPGRAASSPPSGRSPRTKASRPTSTGASPASPGSARSPPSTSRSTAPRTDAAAVVGADLAADGRLHVHRRRPRRRARRARRRRRHDRPGRASPSRLGLTVDQILTRARPPTAGSSTCGSPASSSARIPGRSGESMLVGWSDATTSLGVAGADAFAVRFAPDAPATARGRRCAARPRQLALEVVPLDRIEGAIGDALGRVFGLFDALAAVAVLIAAPGHRQHADHERHRAGPRDRRPARGRDDPPPGLALGRRRGRHPRARRGAPRDRARARRRRPDGRSWPAAGSTSRAGCPWPIIGLALVLGVVVAMLAAAYPARLASRLSIVRAVQYE